MPRQSRTKLVPPKTEPGNQAFDMLEGVSLPEQEKEAILTELDNEIESSFDKLMYSCENCSFLLKCV
jgi:hypothetical protein